MPIRRIIGAVLALLTALFLLAACLWSGFLGYVFIEGRGNDEEAVMVLQPLTCMCMTPAGIVCLVGMLLAMWPDRSATED
jgi:hypothetical protein